MALQDGCVSRADLRALAVQVLIASGTLAGARVYEPHTWPMTEVELPALIVATPTERKESLARGVPQFFTTITLAVLARVAIATEGEAEALLDQLADQVQRAILCSPPMLAPVQQFVSVETHLVISAEGEQFVGEASILFGAEIYQLYEPDAGVPLTEIVTTIPASGTGAPVVFQTTLPP